MSICLLKIALTSPSNAEPDPEEVDTDNQYYLFGKKVHGRYLGFTTMATTFFARGIINDILV